MITSKLSGRTTLFRKSKDMEGVVSWVTDQPEVKSLIPRSWRPGGSKGKIGLKIDNVSASRVAATIYDGTGRQELLVSATSEDAAVAFAARAVQHFNMPMPQTAKNGSGAPKVVVTTAGPRLTGGSTTRQERIERVDDAKEVAVGKINTTLRKITPEIAIKWLEDNKKNRPVSQRVVDRYASDMKAGRWGVSEAVIAFDTNGNLINGQHRLWAVVDSGVAITQNVTEGYPPDAILYFDDGYKRDPVHVYNLSHNSEMTKTHLSVARRFAGGGWRLAKGVKTQELSRQDTYEVLERYRDGIDFAVSQIHCKGQSTAGVKTSAVIAAVARAFYNTPDRARLEEFCSVLVKGLSTGAEDNAAVLLRNWLMTNRVNNFVGQNEAYAKTERALEAFLKREPITRNLYGTTVELFPLPGESPSGEAIPLGFKPKVRQRKMQASALPKAAGKAARVTVN